MIPGQEIGDFKDIKLVCLPNESYWTFFYDK